MSMKKISLLLITLCLCALALVEPAKAATPAATMGFGNIEVPANIANDEFAIKALYFAMKDEARKVKGVKVNYKGGTNESYYVKGVLTYYSWYHYWNQPHASTISKEVWSEDHKWKDDKGKERTRTVSKMTTEVYDVFGSFTFKGAVKGTFYLIKSGDDQVIAEYSGDFDNDKPIDAYRALLKKFYKEVNTKLNR